MKKLFFIHLVLLSFFSCHSEEADTAVTDERQAIMADSAAIMANFERQEACWNKHDLACYVEAYDHSDDVQTISRAGITKGYDHILDNYRRYFPEDRMGLLHFDQMEFKRLSDQYYYIVGQFNLTYEIPDTTLQGWFSVLMEKKNGKWVMISDHSS